MQAGKQLEEEGVWARGAKRKTEKVQAVRLNGQKSEKDECSERVGQTGYAESNRSANNRATEKDERR